MPTTVACLYYFRLAESSAIALSPKKLVSGPIAARLLMSEGAIGVRCAYVERNDYATLV
jgi:hypothetical protein